MTWIDAAAIALVLIYLVFGWYTGLIRRIVGIVAVYVGLLGATFMGGSGSGLLQSLFTLSNPEAHLFSFFATLVIIVVVFEAAASVYHSRLQFAVVPADHLTGALVGALTALAVATLGVVMLQGYSHPFGNGQPTSLQIRVRDTFDHSLLPQYLERIESPIQVVFAPVFPRDPSQYFGSASG